MTDEKIQGQENQYPKIEKEQTNVEEFFQPYSDVSTILSWHAPGRPFKKHSKEYFINGLLILTTIEIIAFLIFHDLYLASAIFSVAFLWFALSIVPPHIFYYKITSEGILIENTFFIWEELYDFYFAEHHGVDVIKIETNAYVPGELTLVLGDITKQRMREALLPFLPFREYVSPSFTQKASDWLGKNFPLEKSS
jgi:hypothetical protein